MSAPLVLAKNEGVQGRVSSSLTRRTEFQPGITGDRDGEPFLVSATLSYTPAGGRNVDRKETKI